jgi:hypothetical protein
MAQANLHTVTPDGSIINIAGVGIVLGIGATYPVDETAGYAPGCLWIDSDATGMARILYNSGSLASCNFDALSTT